MRPSQAKWDTVEPCRWRPSPPAGARDGPSTRRIEMSLPAPPPMPPHDAPTTMWGRVRGLPMWAQILLWLCVAPVLLALIAAQAPAETRRRWWGAAVAAAVVWVAIGASSGSQPERVETEAAPEVTTT